MRTRSTPGWTPDRSAATCSRRLASPQSGRWWRYAPLSGLVLPMAVALASCTQAPPVTDSKAHRARATVEAQLSGTELTILGVEPVDEDLAGGKEPKRSSDPWLRWQVQSENGAVIADGVIADPRIWHSDFDENGQVALIHARGPSALVRIDVPTVRGTLVLYEPTRSTTSLRAAATGAEQSEVASAPIESAVEPVGANPEKIIDNSRCASSVNILILSEGYTSSQLGSFRTHAREVADGFLKLPGFAEYAGNVNVWVQEVASQDEGISDPENGIERTTAFDAAFGVGSIPRRCVLPRNPSTESAKLRQEAERVTQANTTVLLVNNTQETIGCANSAERLVTLNHGETAIDTLAHELAHSLYNLGDEYVVQSECNLGSAGNTPNTTKDPKNPWWSDMVNTDELPTVNGTSDTIGAFEGAEYCEKDVYRPQLHCLMEDGRSSLCAVCLRTAQQYHQTRLEQRRNETSEDCSGDAGTPDGGVDCATGAPCADGLLCAWNGPEPGYCCKAPFEGTKTCFSDEDCSPQICSFGGPPKNAFYCTDPDPNCQPPVASGP